MKRQKGSRVQCCHVARCQDPPQRQRYVKAFSSFRVHRILSYIFWDLRDAKYVFRPQVSGTLYVLINRLSIRTIICKVPGALSAASTFWKVTECFNICCMFSVCDGESLSTYISSRINTLIVLNNISVVSTFHWGPSHKNTPCMELGGKFWLPVASN